MYKGRYENLFLYTVVPTYWYNNADTLAQAEEGINLYGAVTSSPFLYAFPLAEVTVEPSRS